MRKLTEGYIPVYMTGWNDCVDEAQSMLDSNGRTIKHMQKEMDGLMATIAELLAIIETHNASPCPQVFKVEVPAKYRDTSNGGE